MKFHNICVKAQTTNITCKADSHELVQTDKFLLKTIEVGCLIKELGIDNSIDISIYAAAARIKGKVIGVFLWQLYIIHLYTNT